MHEKDGVSDDIGRGSMSWLWSCVISTATPTVDGTAWHQLQVYRFCRSYARVSSSCALYQHR